MVLCVQQRLQPSITRLLTSQHDTVHCRQRLTADAARHCSRDTLLLLLLLVLG
jgi:hypothetical protein